MATVFATTVWFTATDASKPSSNFVSGQLLYAADTNTWYVANSATTWIAAISSGSIGSGQIGRFHVASGMLTDTALASGSSITNAYQAGGVPTVSGNQVGNSYPTTPPVIPSITAEVISGGRCVSFNQSGQLWIAMASVSGRMPAIGITAPGAAGNALSGTTVAWFQVGGLQFTSGMVDYSGYVGKTAWVGRSGQPVTRSGSWNSGGFASGDLVQSVGLIANSGAIYASLTPILFSGNENAAIGPF